MPQWTGDMRNNLEAIFSYSHIPFSGMASGGNSSLPRLTLVWLAGPESYSLRGIFNGSV